MHIVVCVKQVPDTKIIKINPKTNTLDHRSAPAILNPLLTCRTRSGKNKKKAGGKVNIILSSGSI
jgi:electron transfer flavoprotein beta subunit